MRNITTGFLFLILPSVSMLHGKIVWERVLEEHSVQPGETVVTAKFPFTVVGEETKITSIRTSCGCTTTKLEKKIYQPGETGVIEAHFELGSRVGQQNKYVMISTDDKNTPTQNLQISVYIPHVLKIEPRFVYWTKGVKNYHEQMIDLVPDTDIDITIVNITSNEEQLKLRWEYVDEEGLYRVYLQPLIPEGEIPFFRAIIKVEIDSSVGLKQKVFHAYAFMKSA